MSAAVSFGQRLRDARCRRDLSPEQLSHETQIPIAHIEALEAGQLHAIPGGLYRRAEVRAFADAVGLDAAALLAELSDILSASRAGSPHPSGLPPASSAVPEPRRPIWVDSASTSATTAPIESAAPASSNVAPLDPPLWPTPRVSPNPPLRPRASVAPDTSAWALVPPSPSRVLSGARDPRKRWGLAAALLLGAGALLWEQTPPDSAEAARTAGAAASQHAADSAEPQTPSTATAASTAPQRLADDAEHAPRAAPFADIVLPFDAAAEAIGEVMRRVEATERPPSLPRRLLTPPGADAASRSRLASGRLVVQSTPPGARVTVNDVGWGETPVTVRYLPFGALRVRLVMDGQAVERVVQLSPEAPVSTLRVALRGTRRASAAPPRGGPMLRVTTTPQGARVTVNGIGWGTTPLDIPHLPPGVQRVRVVQQGYRSEERVVNVGEGQPGRVSIAMKPVS